MRFVDRYEHVIGWIVGHCPPPDKFAHLCAGLIIWLLAGMLLRAPLRTARPFAVVVVLEVANECVDRLAHGGWMWSDTLGDAAATWFWPFVIMLALRSDRRLRG